MIQLFKLKSLKKTQEKTAQDKKQRGRSMVEMLGVLAIIGVLSIGGISGYTLAMRRYRANEIISLVNKYGLTVYTACQNAMIKDPQHNYIDNISSGDHTIQAWTCANVIPFTDAGLGELPSGVTAIGLSSRGSGYLGYNPDLGFPFTSFIFSNSSGDFVGVSVEFDSKELCETVLSITGPLEVSSMYQGDHDEDLYKACEGSNSYRITNIMVMNN